MTGTMIILEGKEAQAVVDAAMRAAADVMGEHSSDVSILPGFTVVGELL